jgi:hypothetical protein
LVSLAVFEAIKQHKVQHHNLRVRFLTSFIHTRSVYRQLKIFHSPVTDMLKVSEDVLASLFDAEGSSERLEFFPCIYAVAARPRILHLIKTRLHRPPFFVVFHQFIDILMELCQL